MRAYFELLSAEHAAVAREQWWVVGFGLGLAALVCVRLLNAFMGMYVTTRGGPALNDIFLDAVTRVDVVWLHLFLSSVMYTLVIGIFVFFPRRAPFLLWTLVTVILLRVCALPLTELGMYVDAVRIDSEYTFGGDLFFSGHVAIATTLVYFYWDTPLLRALTLGMLTVTIGTLILGHLHYSIDIFTGLFVGYGAAALVRNMLPMIVEKSGYAT
jgi:membrane-associated phospholipid phosphatase